MYLSRLLLTGEQLRNPYEVHRALWQAFPKKPDQSRDFLFRVEQRKTGQVQVLMQSHRKPESNIENVRLLAGKEVVLGLQSGGQLRFLLVANPVKTIADEQGRLDSRGEVKKCRVPLIKEEEQVEWLKRKLADAASINMVEIEKLAPLYFRKTGGSGKKGTEGQRGKIQPYTFKGVLQINNADLLTLAIQNGIGPAKAFGCGLLSLART